MAKTLYFECASGISGDMTVAALLDLGASSEKLMQVLDSLPVQGFEVRITRVKKSGLDACDFDVVLDEAHENHDHDMAYLHDHDHDHDRYRRCHERRRGAHRHDHEHDEHGRCHHHHHHDHHESHHHHHHDHEHGDEHHHHHEGYDHRHDHEHRNLGDVCAIIDASCATERAKAIAHRIFEILAQAEARAHGAAVEDVHFHEVGAIDSIVDILACAVCLDDLDVEDVVVTHLAEGRGTIRCQHGIIPVPVPAVVNIAQEHAIAFDVLPIRGELVTPTGAAIVAAMRTQSALPARFVVKRVGVGAGKRVYETPGIVRIMEIESVS